MFLHSRSGDHTPPGHPSRSDWHASRNPNNIFAFNASPFIRFRGLELDDDEMEALVNIEDDDQDAVSDDSLILNLQNLAG